MHRFTAASVSMLSETARLFQVLLEELRQLIEGDRVLSAAIIQIRMNDIRDDEQFLIVPGQLGKSILAEIAGVSLLPVHDQNSAADFIGVAQNRLVKERHTAGLIPAAVGVEGAGMIATAGLV